MLRRRRVEKLTRFIGELLGGCGSVNSWDGVWPKLRIWFSRAWQSTVIKHLPHALNCIHFYVGGMRNRAQTKNLILQFYGRKWYTQTYTDRHWATVCSAPSLLQFRCNLKTALKFLFAPDCIFVNLYVLQSELSTLLNILVCIKVCMTMGHLSLRLKCQALVGD